MMTNWLTMFLVMCATTRADNLLYIKKKIVGGVENCELPERSSWMLAEYQRTYFKTAICYLLVDILFSNIYL